MLLRTLGWELLRGSLEGRDGAGSLLSPGPDVALPGTPSQASWAPLLPSFQRILCSRPLRRLCWGSRACTLPSQGNCLPTPQVLLSAPRSLLLGLQVPTCRALGSDSGTEGGTGTRKQPLSLDFYLQKLRQWGLEARRGCVLCPRSSSVPRGAATVAVSSGEASQPWPVDASIPFTAPDLTTPAPSRANRSQVRPASKGLRSPCQAQRYKEQAGSNPRVHGRMNKMGSTCTQNISLQKEGILPPATHTRSTSMWT